MQEIVRFDSNQVATFKNENVGAVLLDFKALQVDSVTVAAIADLNKISLEIAVFRNGSMKPEYIFNDYLEYILRAIAAGSTKYEIAVAERTQGYLIAIPFDGCLKLNGKDYMTVKVKANPAAFTALSSPVSDITIETIPASTNNPTLSIVEAITYSPGEVQVDKNLGDNIAKIVLVHDLTADYEASAEAKPVNGIDITANGYKKLSSENAILIENLMMTQYNPETAIKDLVLYNNAMPISNVRYAAKYDQAVTADSKIMVVRRKMF